MLGVGEIGLNKCTPNEVATLAELIQIALDRDEQMLFHTPHLEEKYRGHRGRPARNRRLRAARRHASARVPQDPA